MARGTPLWKLSRTALVLLGASVGVFAVLVVARGASEDVVLSDQVGAGAVCLSSVGANNANPACDPLFRVTVRAPGDAASTDVTLANTGSTDAQTFSLFAPSCLSADAPGETYHGSGSVCDALQMIVQEYSDSGFSTPLACRYGASTGPTCDFSDLAATVSAFASAHSDPASGLDMGALSTGTPRYFRVRLRLVPSAGNPVQGRKASFDMSWYAAATAPACTVTGTDGADALVGMPGSDIICGLGGNDTIDGMGGNDTIDGGAGTDSVLYRGAFSGVRVDLAVGTTTGWTTDALTGIEVAWGSDFIDVLRGSAANDILRGFAGNDKLRGRAGDDVLKGGKDNDKVKGGAGSDVLKGGGGNDFLRARDQIAGNDMANGGKGGDRCTADPGDRVKGCP